MKYVKNLITKCWRNWLQLSISPPFISSFFVQKCFMQLLYNYSLALQFFCISKLGKKPVCEMSVKLTTGLNFINVLLTAFTLIDPKSIKRHWWLNCIFTLLGSTRAKAVQRTLMKLTPGVGNFMMEKFSFKKTNLATN